MCYPLRPPQLIIAWAGAKRKPSEPQGLSQIFGRFTTHRPEEPVLGEPKAQHRLFTAVREIPSLLSS